MNLAHLPLLIEYILATDGPVLEVGTHNVVTPILNELCHNRILVTVEPLAEARVWATQYLGRRHVVASQAPPDVRFSVALIGLHRPEDRIKWIDAVCDRADFLIVPECGPKGKNYQVDYFPYRRVYAWLDPPTLVCSKTKPCNTRQ